MSPRGMLGAGIAGAVAVVGAVYVGMNLAGPKPAPAPPPVKLVEMIGMKYPMGQTLEALQAPVPDAPGVTRVRQGSDVQVVGVVEGDGWYQIQLPDQRLAYVPVAAIPAAATPAAAPVSAPPVTPTPVTTPAAAASPPQQPAPPPPPQDAYAQPPPPDAGASPVVDVPPVVQFAEAHDIMRVVSPTAVYLKPDRQAPQAYPVAAGTQVYVVARSTDGRWAWVETADNAPAYMPQADIAP